MRISVTTNRLLLIGLVLLVLVFGLASQIQDPSGVSASSSHQRTGEMSSGLSMLCSLGASGGPRDSRGGPLGGQSLRSPQTALVLMTAYLACAAVALGHAVALPVPLRI